MMTDRLRSPWAIASAIGCIFAFGLTSTMLAAPEAPGAAKGVIAAVSLALLACAVRLFLCRLDVTQGGVAYHGFLVSRRYEWADIAEVTYEQIDEKLVPVVSICLAGRFPYSGVLRVFAGYEIVPGRKNGRVDRQVHKLVELQRRYSGGAKP